MTKTIESLVENYQPKDLAEAEVCEVLMEAMDQYPDLKKMEMAAGPSDKSMVEEGYGEGDYESDPVEGIKSAFKAAMMKVLDDDSLDDASCDSLGKSAVVTPVSASSSAPPPSACAWRAAVVSSSPSGTSAACAVQLPSASGSSFSAGVK